MTRQEELALVKKIGQGDSDAATSFLVIYRPVIYRLSYRFFPANPAERHDAISDVISDVVLNLHKFAGRSRLSTWIYRVAHNRLKEIIRSAKAGRRPPLTYVGDMAELATFGTVQAIDPISQSTMKMQVAGILASVSAEEAQLLKEHFLEDRMLKDMACSRNMPLNTLKCLVYRATKHARKLAAQTL